MDNAHQAALGDFSCSPTRTTLSALLQVVNEERAREFLNDEGEVVVAFNRPIQSSGASKLHGSHLSYETTTDDHPPQHPGNAMAAMSSVSCWSSQSHERAPDPKRYFATRTNPSAAEYHQQWERVDEDKVHRHSSATILAHSVYKYLTELREKFHREAHSFGALGFKALEAEALKLKEQQDRFRSTSKPTLVDVGIHITQSTNMPLIRQYGLRSSPEREALGIKASFFNGASLGHGIYTANDLSHLHYGGMCLLVARLRGVESTDSHEFAHDTFVRGNEVVLRSSSQCLLLMEFSTGTSHMVLRQAYIHLQKLVQENFNVSVSNAVQSVRRTQQPPAGFSQPHNLILDSSAFGPVDTTAFQTKCVVCFSWMQARENLVSLKVCGHVGHYECFVSEIDRRSSGCPRCNKCIVSDTNLVRHTQHGGS